MHAAWYRVDTETGLARDPDLFKLRLKEVLRTSEKEFALREVSNHRQAHDRARVAERKEVEEARRLGTDVRAIRTAILDCFEHSDNGRAFKAASSMTVSSPLSARSARQLTARSINISTSATCPSSSSVAARPNGAIT
jgi:hypothetical protein